MQDRPPIALGIFIALFFASIFSIGFWIPRHHATLLFTTFITAFASHLFIYRYALTEKWLLIIGILARLPLFLSLPSLSDDFYRFLWDGYLLQSGIHPFKGLPAQFLDLDIPGLTLELYEKLNSKNYFTVYPPINQYIFQLSVLIGKSNWLVAADFMRLILLLCDLGSWYYLRKVLILENQQARLAFLYFLNPLVILELTGNLHFEGMVIFFLLIGIYHFRKNHVHISAIGFGMAIGTKLLPLIYLPGAFFLGLQSKKWLIAVLGGLLGLSTLAPMISPAFINGLQNSLDLYFRKFEFNASLYFLVRAIGLWITGYNPIAIVGPLLSAISALSIILTSLVSYKKGWKMPFTFMIILSIYLFFATTVHPWYILPLVVFGLLSGYYYPIAWSFLIFLTYLGYNKDGFELPMYLVALEYFILGLFIWVEIKIKKEYP